MDTALVGVTHVVRRHVVGGFADQMLKQVAVRLGDTNRFQRHTVFTQRRFHVLERFTHAAVFWQQVVAQRTGNGTGDPAIQRSFDQTIEFATVRCGAQTTRDDAQIEHQRVVIGNGVELFKLHAFHRLELVFQLVKRQHARLAFVQGFGHQLCRLHRHRQSLNGKWFDIHFTIASGNLLQTHTDHHALVARVNGVEHRITDTRFQLTVQTFIARTAGGPGFRSVTEMQQGQVGDQRRNERRHGGGFTRPVTARKRRDQLVKVKSSGKKAVPVNQRQ